MSSTQDDGIIIQPLPEPVVNDGLVIDEDDDGTTSGDLFGQEEDDPSNRHQVSKATSE
jgi:hypothetical protein